MRSATLLTVATLLAAPGAVTAASTAIAVEAPTPLTVDGLTSDWGFITRAQGIRRSDGSPAASFRLAYDDQRLYALFEVIDDSPLVNGAAVREELIKGGDCVGLALQALKDWPARQRLIAAQVDGEPVLIAMRPEWKREKRPHTYLSPVKEVAMDDVGPVEDAELAFRKVPGGYVAELSVTWKSLNINQRHTIGFDAQVIYGDGAGTTNIDSAWWHTSGGDAMTVEDLPSEAALYPEQWGEVKLRDSDPGPDLEVAGAFSAKPAGIPISFELPRDAMVTLAVTDADGFILREVIRAEPMAAGTHRVEWDGRDRYGEALPPGSYQWKLIHFEPLRSRLIGSVGNSARPPYRTADGKGSMGGQHGGHSVVATGPTGIYLMGGTEEGHPAMRAVDAENRTLWKRSLGGWGAGRAATTVGDSLYMVVGTSKTGAKLWHLDGATGDNRELAGTNRPMDLGDKDWFKAVGDLAVIGDVAYISLPSRDQIERVDLRSGKHLDALTIPAPRATAVVEGALLVCSEGSLLRVDPDSGKRESFITGLDQPSAVCLDRTGQIYIAEQGQRQQVSRFTSDGKLIDRIGVPGGRPRHQDPYDPNALRQVVAIGVGPKDQLWVVEKSWLRRVAVFSLEGTWLSDQFGPTAYNVVGPDLDDFSTVFYQPIGGKPLYAETAIDYAAFMADPESPMDAWSMRATHLLTQTGVIPGANDDDEHEMESGTDDLMIGATAKGYGHIVAFTADNGQRYLWRVAKHNRATAPTGAGIFIERDGKWIPAAYVTNDHKGEELSWADTNGDGLVQGDERYAPPPTRYFAWLDRDLVLWGREGRLAPTAIDARGVPSYDGAELQPYLAPGAGKIPDGWVFNSMPDAEGAVYFAGNLGTHRHLGFWDRACENLVMKIADGEIKWVVGEHAPTPSNTNPRTHTTLTGIAGVVDGMVIAHDVDHYVAYTDDGLILGDPLLDDELGRQRTGPVAIYIESFTGLFVKDPTTGRKVLFSVRSGDDPIIEILGGDDIQRQTGRIELDSSRAREVIEDDRVVIPYETWWGNKGRGYEIDGNDWEWLPRPAGVPVHADGTVVGNVRLRRDAGSLFVLADVLADAVDGDASADAAEAWGNSQGVELLLATATGGDAVRLFLSATGGKDGSGLLRHAGDAGWTTVSKATVRVVPRWQGYGWRLEAEVPLEALPGTLTTTVEQTFRRREQGDSKLVNLTEQRLDLVGPLRLNAAIHRRVEGAIQRAAWIQDGAPLTAPERIDPKRWGTAEARVVE